MFLICKIQTDKNTDVSAFFIDRFEARYLNFNIYYFKFNDADRN